MPSTLLLNQRTESSLLTCFGLIGVRPTLWTGVTTAGPIGERLKRFHVPCRSCSIEYTRLMCIYRPHSAHATSTPPSNFSRCSGSDPVKCTMFRGCPSTTPHTRCTVPLRMAVGIGIVAFIASACVAAPTTPFQTIRHCSEPECSS